jgi:hypothetical protein
MRMWKIKVAITRILDGTAELLNQCQQTPNFRVFILRGKKNFLKTPIV